MRTVAMVWWRRCWRSGLGSRLGQGGEGATARARARGWSGNGDWQGRKEEKEEPSARAKAVTKGGARASRATRARPSPRKQLHGDGGRLPPLQRRRLGWFAARWAPPDVFNSKSNTCAPKILETFVLAKVDERNMFVISTFFEISS